jgi:hypothetical protein
MEPFQAKAVAAAMGSTLTALSSLSYYSLLRIFLFTVPYSSDSIRRGQNPPADPASKYARCATYQRALLRVLPAD